MAVNDLRVLRIGFWLGWQMDTNWAAPFWFFVYSVVRPLAMSSILVVMYLVVTSGHTHTDMFAGVYLGNALWMYVGSLGMGLSMAVVEEREWFQTLKYIFLGTSNLFSYVVGRAGAKFVATSIAILVVLGAGILFLDVPIRLGAVHWPAFILAMLCGVVMAAGLGLAMAGVMLLAMRTGSAYAEALAGALFVFTGTLFPLDLLPRWGQAIGMALPFTYWLEELRRAVFGMGFAQQFSPRLAAIPEAMLWTVLAVGAAGMGLMGVIVFRWAERIARERGLIDQLTEH